MKVLIADTLPQAHVDRLREICGDVDYEPTLTDESLVSRLPGANVLIVRGTRVRAAAIAAAEELQLIVRAGAGTENIDLAEASTRGVYVTNCPDKNAAAVAELTIGLLVSVDRNIPEQDTALKERRWQKDRFQRADGLKGKTFGVVGMGSIGREVTRRAKALDMTVLAWSRNLTAQKAAELGVKKTGTLDELVVKSDIISLHVALTPDTKHLISAQQIALMRPGTIILNTSRGAVIDTKALVEALKTGRIRAGLDVYENEPKEGDATFNDAVADVPNWVGTHHIGASTRQAQTATADETVRIVETYLKTGAVENCVNFAKETPAMFEMIVRHYNRIGVLTGILTELRESKINVHEVHNVMFESANAAVAHIQIGAYPSTGTLERIVNRKSEIISVRIVKLQQAAAQNT